MTVDDLTCRAVAGLLTEYLEGALPASERSRLEQHLATCPNCTCYFDSLRLTIRLLGMLPPESIAPELMERLLAAFRGWRAAD
ncbi:MAG TPA: zf-HC2 domain-containing protein [Ktedonobacterales bacterium]|nr:zf-HC2 domain-containing protein [Ktedonobacterales bacterium]